MQSDYMYELVEPVGKNFDPLFKPELTPKQMLEYGCTEFTSCTEGNTEIAISYWETQAQIKAWKQNAEHLTAQSLGKSTWYKSYRVQVVEVVREYSSSAG